jgi:hypothetical protein
VGFEDEASKKGTMGDLFRSEGYLVREIYKVYYEKEQ